MMSVAKALRSRRSIRRFLPNTTVSRRLVEQILEDAARTPSGGNVQPWKVYVVAGKKKQELIQTIAERFTKSMEKPAYNVFPPKLTNEFMDRRRDIAKRMYGALQIGFQDKHKRVAHVQHNLRFFDAPVGMILTLDRQMEHGQYADLGMFMQSIMLAAEEQGLATCPQTTWAEWPKAVAEALQIPDNEEVIAGIALGFADEKEPVNHLQTPRLPLSEFVRFYDDEQDLS